MILKQVKVIDDSGSKVVAINVDQVVRVNPVGGDKCEIVLSNGDLLPIENTLVENIKWLTQGG